MLHDGPCFLTPRAAVGTYVTPDVGAIPGIGTTPGISMTPGLRRSDIREREIIDVQHGESAAFSYPSPEPSGDKCRARRTGRRRVTEWMRGPMKSAIGIGGRVIAVDVTENGGNFVARYETPSVSAESALVGDGVTYEDALVSLRARILAFRKQP
jgi:hypothetical protein